MDKILSKIKRVATTIIAALILFTGCSGTSGENTPQSSVAETGNSSATDSVSISYNLGGTGDAIVEADYDDEDLEAGYDADTAVKITLSGSSASIGGEGATAGSGVVTISQPGTYILSGSLADGQIIVDCTGEGTVRLVLDGINITSLTTSPLYIKNAEKTIITLADGSQNNITDTNTESYVFDDTDSQEPNAAIFSKDDLVINGSGSLTVNANYNNGISSNDYLKITGGVITVNAADGGIRGKNYVAVRDGDITVISANDGLYSTNSEDEGKGYIAIEGGNLNITSGHDGIQAASSVCISGGDISVESGGGSANATLKDTNDFGGWNNRQEQQYQSSADDDESISCKGIKAGMLVSITGGSFAIDSADDAIHSDDSIAISDGTFLIASGDDGMHANAYLQIGGGNITIENCYEGLESSNIDINGGDIHINASDDGINIAGGNDGNSTSDMQMRQDEFAVLENCFLDITAGYIYINANGDGLDSNGSINITGGTILVSGPVESMNGALDYNGTCTVTGGFLAAAGSAGMAMAPSSGQSSVLITLPQAQQAGTVISIVDEDGSQIISYGPEKEYQTLMLSSSLLTQGKNYCVYLGGSPDGSQTDGMYTGGEFSGGSKMLEFTMSDNIIYVSESGVSASSGSNFPGGGGFRQGDGMQPGGGGPDRRP